MHDGPPIKNPLALEPAIDPAKAMLRPHRRSRPMGLSHQEMIERLLHKPGRRIHIISEPHGKEKKEDSGDAL